MAEFENARETRRGLSVFAGARRHQADLAIVLALAIGVAGVAALAVPDFRTPYNVRNVLVQMVPLAIVAVGQTFVILTAGIDLSVGPTIALVNVVIPIIMGPSLESMLLSSVVGILIGAAVGTFNAFGVVVLRVAPFIVTLASMTAVQGLALHFRPQPGGLIPDGYGVLFNGSLPGWLGSVPLPILLLVVLGIIASLILNYTTLGRHIYAVGGYEAATRLGGLQTDLIKGAAYVACGAIAGIGGLFITSKIMTGDALVGGSFSLDSITAVVLGGTSLFGGRGGVAGTVVAAFIVVVLSNILNLMSVSTYYQYIFKGVILIAAVALYSFRHRR